MEQVYTPTEDYKVLVNCMTYNQSKYIEDALNGFAMQKTDFPFVCLVMDDASTDGEQEVIKAWMERECDMEKAEYIDVELSNIILVPHIHNANCVFAFYFLKRNLWKEQELKTSLFAPWREHCEYEAMCEGDDYWIDSLKLNKQISFLDENKEYIFSHTGFDFYEQANKTLLLGDEIILSNLELEKSNKDNLNLEILDNNHYRIQTCTVVIRMGNGYQYALEELKKISGMFLMGDTQLWVFLLQKGEVHFLKDKTAIYRKCSGSACRQPSIESRLRFKLSCEEMRVYMSEILRLDKNYVKKFRKQYKRRLIIYKCFAVDYMPFISLSFDNRFQKIAFKIFTSSILMFIAKPFYKLYIKICYNLS